MIGRWNVIDLEWLFKWTEQTIIVHFCDWLEWGMSFLAASEKYFFIYERKIVEK